MKKKHFSGDFGPKGPKKGSKQCFSSFVENRYVDFFYFLLEVIPAYKLKIDLIERSDEKSCINVFQPKWAQNEVFQVSKINAQYASDFLAWEDLELTLFDFLFFGKTLF